MLPTRSDGPRLELEPTPPTSNQKPAVLPTQESSKSVDPPAPELPRPIVEYPMPSKPMAPSKADLVVPGPDIPPEGKPATPLPLDLPPAKPMGSEPATSGNGTTPHRPGSESPAAPPLTIDPPTQRHPPAQSLPKPEKAADLRPLTSPNPQPNLVPPKDVGKPNSGKMPPPLETGPKPPSVPPVPVPSESGPKPPTEPPATLGSRPAPADPLETRVDSYDEDWYYCKSGDTLEAISQKFYYTPKYEQALRQYNLDRNYKPIFRQDKPILPSGEVVKVPPARILERTYPTLIPGYRSRTNEPVQTTPAAVRNPGQAPSSNLESIGSPRVYTVRREGMTLRDIAREELRDENQWTRIFNLNRQWNPSAPLPVGTSIYLPGSP
jgi:nucleoid-associated protein YgaU